MAHQEHEYVGFDLCPRHMLYQCLVPRIPVSSMQFILPFFLGHYFSCTSKVIVYIRL